VTDPSCYFHGVEPVPADCYRVCGECGHAFTAAGLLAEHNKVAARIHAADEAERTGTVVWSPTGEWVGGLIPDLPPNPETDPDAIPFCPLCAHDF
jgi:hypothetical protein